MRFLIGALALPFVALIYIWGTFAVYAFWCEAIRDVDMGMGDSWRVPLVHGYSLTMIDTPDQAFVLSPDGRQLHHDLTRIGTTDTFVAGDIGSAFFLIDAERGTETVLRSESDLQAALREARASPVRLLRPGEYYYEHRWGRGDGIAAGLILGPPLLSLCVFAFRFLRAAHSRPSSAFERSS